MKKILRQCYQFLKKKPYLAFFLSLAIFLSLVCLSYVLRQPEAEPEIVSTTPLQVAVDTGGIHYLTAQARLETDGVVEIIAQTGGIVSKINFSPGDNVKKGQSLLTIGTNYQGANAAGVQAAQARLSYQSQKDTIDLQKEVIGHNRELTLGQFEQNEKQLEWSKDSFDQTKAALANGRKLLDGIKDTIKELEKLPDNATNSANLQQARSSRFQIESSIIQADTSLKNLEYTIDEDNFPSKAPEIQKELALKQLELQEKALDTQLEAARLTSALAGIQASLTTPASPFAGTVERINVKKGDMVGAGQVLAVISASGGSQTMLNVALPASVASSFMMSKEAYLISPFTGERFAVEPSYVSSVPINGSAYNIYFALPEEISAQLEPKSYVTLELPFNSQLEGHRSVPIDSVYQTQFENYLYVVADNEEGSPSASLRLVELGPVTGNLVTILSGIDENDWVILNRQVKEGQHIQVLSQDLDTF